MKAAFGDAVVRTCIFDAREMPHGATRALTDTYFILHAPHAASASLVLVDEAASGGRARVMIPMSLTGETFYPLFIRTSRNGAGAHDRQQGRHRLSAYRRGDALDKAPGDVGSLGGAGSNVVEFKKPAGSAA